MRELSAPHRDLAATQQWILMHILEKIPTHDAAHGFVPGRGTDFNAKTAATTPLKRIATPEDIASAILACATQLGFATGTTFVVDGGRSL